MGMQSEIRGRAFSAINVTPFVDVTLVLLIIFMVVTPILDSDGVVVPRVRDPESIPEKSGELKVSIGLDGTVALNSVFLRRDELPGELARAFEVAPERSVVVRGDHRLSYGEVTEVLGMCREVGFRRVGLAAEAIDAK